jgi:lipopolysaccharide export system protein LptA
MTGNRFYSIPKALWILLVLFMVPIWNADAGESTASKKPKIDAKQPIQIVSDRLDAYNEKKLVVFSGNAVATQADRVIRSDKLLLYYRKDAGETRKSAQKDAGEMGELEKIEAKGRVSVTQGEKIVTGDDAVYFQDTQKIVMTGNAVMREGRNVIRGDRIVVFLDEDRGIVESNENKRVKAIIYPEDEKDKVKDKKGGRR